MSKAFHFCCVVTLLMVHAGVWAQSRDPKLNKRNAAATTLMMVNDTLYYQFGDEERSVLVFAELDSVNRFNAPQVYDGKPSYWVFSAGGQRMTVGHDNGKQPQTLVKVVNGQRVKWLDIRFFEPVAAHFSPAYQQEFRGKVTCEIPEAYELANIALALTSKGVADSNMIQHRGSYYQEVMRHFAPYARHRLVQRLDSLVRDSYSNYYSTRENAYAFRLTNTGRPEKTGIYTVLWQGNSDMVLHPAEWEDFARRSGFRDFYRRHQGYYDQTIERISKLLPVAAMQQWLEAQFPARYDCMRIICSPLIGGSHSAQQVADNGFRESLMFISDDFFLDSVVFNEAQRSALYSGVVFTEIDHNYVNPVSDEYLPQIKSAFKQRAHWVAPGMADWYGGEYEVFNEYMTHAVHLLWVKSYYPPEVYHLVRKDRIALNVRRGFIRFETFVNELEQLFDQRTPGQTIAALYPRLLQAVAVKD